MIKVGLLYVYLKIRRFKVHTISTTNAGDNSNVINVCLWGGVQMHMAMNASIVKKVHLQLLSEVAYRIPVHHKRKLDFFTLLIICLLLQIKLQIEADNRKLYLLQ